MKKIMILLASLTIMVLPIVKAADNIKMDASESKSGVITVEMFDYVSMAKESIKLLSNYEYRKKKGEEAKLSLLDYETNDEKVDMWGKLFHSLLNSTEDYNRLQREVEKKYYNATLAKEHLKKHYHYVQQFNPYFKCHSFEDFTNLQYINNLYVCKI